MLYERGFLGIAAGVSWAILGYTKSAKKEKFDPHKFISSIILGAIIGLISEYSGLSMELIKLFLIQFGLVGMVENFIKTIYRRLIKKSKNLNRRNN